MISNLLYVEHVWKAGSTDPVEIVINYEPPPYLGGTECLMRIESLAESIFTAGTVTTAVPAVYSLNCNLLQPYSFARRRIENDLMPGQDYEETRYNRCVYTFAKKPDRISKDTSSVLTYPDVVQHPPGPEVLVALPPGPQQLVFTLDPFQVQNNDDMELRMLVSFRPLPRI